VPRLRPANPLKSYFRRGVRVASLLLTLLAPWPALADLPPAPDLESRSGTPFDLADFDGQTLLINFWAAWCGPCRAEMPDLDELQKRYSAQPFQVIGVAADERDSVEQFLSVVPVDYPIYIGNPDRVFDWSGELGNRAFALPFSVLVDRAGNKRWQKLGGRISVADIAPVIDGLLAEETPPPAKPAGMPDFGDAPPPLPRGGAGVKPVMPGTAAPDGLGVTMARSPTAGAYDTDTLTYVPWADPAEIRPLQVGEALPAGSVVRDASGAEVDLDAAVRQQPSVLIYYRGGWCPFCNAHLRELQKIVPELTGMGYQLLAVSTDPVEAVRAHEESTNYSYRLLSDADLGLAAKLGLKYKVVDQYIEHVRSLPAGHAFDIVERTGGYLATPAAIVFDTRGVACFVYANNNYTVRVSQQALLDAARAALDG